MRALRGEKLPAAAIREPLGERLPLAAGPGDEPPSDGTSEADRVFQIPIDVEATLALLNMLTVIRESAVLYDILWTVIDKPSILSVIGNPASVSGSRRTSTRLRCRRTTRASCKRRCLK